MFECINRAIRLERTILGFQMELEGYATKTTHLKLLVVGKY